MNKDKYEKYDTEFQKYLIDRFADTLPEKCEYPYDRKTQNNYLINSTFEWLLYACKPYQVEDKMLKFAKAHPEASLQDFDDYFMEIVPPGTLPPDADEWEDDEE